MLWRLSNHDKHRSGGGFQLAVRVISIDCGQLTAQVKAMNLMIRKFIVTVACILGFWGTSAAQDAYSLSAGDEVSIIVFGQPELSMSVKLNENGVINFPLLGALNAEGLTVTELENTIKRELTGTYLVNPDVRISVAEYRQVYINGEVNSPGAFDYKPGLTLDKAVALAGGYSEKASKERVTLTRVINGVSQRFSMRPTDLVLPGDIIAVDEYLQIFVNGEVQRPGNYPYQAGLTLEKTIALAGGFTGRASKKRIKVSRDIDGQQQQGKIKMRDPVYPGDIISVPEGFF